MARTITIPDEAYERLERMAAQQHQTPGDFLAEWLASLPGKSTIFVTSRVSFTGFLRELGLDDEMIARVERTQDAEQSRTLFVYPKASHTRLLRGLGLDDELIAHVLAAPEEQQPHELRLALAALAEEQENRDPLKQPRYMTFEQFFRELGHTDEEIEEAKRRGAVSADL